MNVFKAALVGTGHFRCHSHPGGTIPKFTLPSLCSAGFKGGAFSSTMASRLALKVNSKRVGSPCREHRVVLLSPVGKIEIWGCDRGVHGIKLPQMSALPSGAESSSACEVCEGTEGMPEPLQQCTAWLRAYFSEPGDTGTLPVPALHHPLLQTDSFTRQVLWTLLNDVKFGEAVSYKQLAELAGNSRAARAVGGAMRSNPIPIIIPCHRVIRSSGDTGNYGGGQILKEWLLSHERMQKEKLQKEKVQEEKLQEKLQEKLEKERMQEKLKEEKLQKERMQEEKIQKERMQEEKMQKERMQEKLQKEKLQEEKLQEKLQKERMQEERMQEKQQKERMQEEKMQKEGMQEEKMQERMQEKLQQEKMQKEKLQEEKMQKERMQEKLQEEKMQKERMQEKLQEEKMQKERMQEKLQKERMQEKLQQEKLHQEKLQQEKLLC